MTKLHIVFCCFLFGTTLTFATEVDYYWRQYSGTVPADAIIGGENINKQNVYIGQAYIHGEGLIVAQINPGVKEVQVPIKGVRNITRYIKILCGNQEFFSWLPTNSTNLHVDLIDKHVIIGGHEDGLGSLNIGRISYEGGTQIGKINAFVVGNSYFRWADIYGKEPGAKSYEVLIYQKGDKCISPK